MSDLRRYIVHRYANIDMVMDAVSQTALSVEDCARLLNELNTEIAYLRQQVTQLESAAIGALSALEADANANARME